MSRGSAGLTCGSRVCVRDELRFLEMHDSGPARDVALSLRAIIAIFCSTKSPAPDRCTRDELIAWKIVEAIIILASYQT
jgi:hypothetical protein